MTTVASVIWPVSRAADGLHVLARAARLPVTPIARTPDSRADHMAEAARGLGLEAEPFDAAFDEVEEVLSSAGPAVIRLGEESAVLLVSARGRRITVVGPDHAVVTLPAEDVRRALVDPAREPLMAEAQRIVQQTGVRASRRTTVVRALVDDRLRGQRVRAGWLVRLPSAAPFGAQLVAARARRQLALLVAAHAGQYASWIAAWWLLGRAALQGHLDSAWLGAWTLALVTVIPLQLAAFWLQGRLAITVGALLKQRLLAGAMRLEPEETRREGAGHLLGRVIEAEAVESLALGGGFAAVFAALELVLAAAVLALATPSLALLLLIWLAVAALLGAVFFRRRLAWVRVRLRLTLELIENMVGHRTRVAQEHRDRWHTGEDESIEQYVQTSTAMDRAAVWLLAIVPRGWMLVGLCGLIPVFMAGRADASMAIGLGGILLAFRALDRLTTGVWSLAGAALAWQQTAPVFRAASRAPLPTPKPESPLRAPGATLEATDLRFAHAGRSEPVLKGCSIAIDPGERVVLGGPSGAGKSTLASLLAGMRAPDSGSLLLDGLDRHTLEPSGWRRRVVLVPQFHENHLVLGSVAFNVLMGVEWPPSEENFERADAVLRELGLGPTLDRMPSGILQTIGETGWQLSHGERSRVFLARALLQNPDVLILDESFAQLDPENMKLALDAVTARGSSVLLIAHA
jgi:ATP-binding cassette subfamily B protein